MKKQVLAHFEKIDPVLFAVALEVVKFSAIELEKSPDYFFSLCREIIGQQLAGAAARKIFHRFVGLFPDEKITPEGLLALPDQTIRDVGPSWAKVAYLKDLALQVHHQTINLRMLDTLEDDLVVRELTKIKGVGPWTAEMFLMFSLGRSDIFSLGDLGLKRAIQKLYKLKREPTQRQLQKISLPWSPYRTYASRILWASLELPL